MTKHLRAVALATALAFTSGCFGSFTATRKLWKFNDGASDNKAVKELVYLALVIIPVYELFALGDALIFNSVEFWTGNNPLTTAMKDKDGHDVTVQRTEHGLRIEREGKVLDLTVGESFAEARDARGVLLARVTEDETGRVVARDASGNELLSRTQAEVAQLAAAGAGSPSLMLRLLEQQEAGTLVANAR